ELRANRDSIVQVVRAEEDRFDAVLTNGLPRLEEALDRAAAGNRVLGGDEAFRLYDSLGVPLDFMEDLAGQRSLGIDREGYDRAMEAQRERARMSGSFDTRKAQEFSYSSDASRALAFAPGDRFEGYASTSVRGVPVVAVFDADRRQVAELGERQQGFVVLERTPFY